MIVEKPRPSSPAPYGRFGARPEDAPEAIIKEARRRARRRRQRYAGAVCLLLMAGLGVFISSGGAGAPSLGARSQAMPLATPVHVPMKNGPIGVYGFLGGVRTLRPAGRYGPFEARCAGQCTEVWGAAWSADGRILAYSSTCGGACGTLGNPHHGIHVRHVRTGRDQLIVHSDSFGPLAITQDGSWIAYADNDRLFVVPADGRTPVRRIATTAGGLEIRGVSWSPNASLLAYSAGHWVYTVGEDGSRTTRLAAGWAPAWSADGRSIAFIAPDGTLRAVSPDGSGGRLITRLPSSCHGCDRTAYAGTVWSPDGHDIGLVSPQSITIVSAATGAILQTIPLPDEHDRLAWQPVA